MRTEVSTRKLATAALIPRFILAALFTDPRRRAALEFGMVSVLPRPGGRAATGGNGASGSGG
jgi:hypothetical protein